MKKKLMDILACPECRFEELELIILKENEEIEEGVIYCSNCKRFYPIIDGIPVMLPDEIRDGREDIAFLQRWRKTLPKKITLESVPFNLKLFDTTNNTK